MQISFSSQNAAFIHGVIPGQHYKDIIAFDSPEFGSVRTLVDAGGDLWFVAADVCAALDLSNMHSSLALLDEDEKGLRTMDTLGGPQEMTTVSEPGLYSLILRSRKPEAKAFKRWITHEVIPSIRKRGMYATPQTVEDMIANPDAAISMLLALKEERNAREEAENLARIECERAEHYKATKAQIGSRREATAMATASAAVRRVSSLENQLGDGKDYKQVKAIPWLLHEFEESRAMYQQVGKKLKSMSGRMGCDTITVPCPEYPEGIKAYHVSVIEALRQSLATDLNMLSKYRKR